MSVLMRFFCLAVSFIVVSVTGCIVGPDHCPPPADVAEAWRHTDGTEVNQNVADLSYWWYQFEDDTLNALMDEALAQNLGLEQAVHRVIEARFQRCVVRGDLFPQINADAAYSFNKTAIQGGIFGQLGGGGFRGIDTTIDAFSHGFSGSWEPDVFGRLRRSVEAADADTQSFVWAYRDVMILMMADVASNYVDARAFQRRIEIARDNLRGQKEYLRIVKDRVPIDGEVEVGRAEANLYSAEATIPTLEAGYQTAVNRLSVLLGRPPGYVDELMSYVGPIPRPPMEVAVGIPADLLRRRPDIRQAERALAAQSARIGVAVADLYPRFTISGNFGVNAQDLSQIYTFNSIGAAVGPTVQWNLFNFGRVRCNIRVQEERAIQLALQYQDTVLTAAEEVDNSLVAYFREKQRYESLTKSVDAYHKVEDILKSQQDELIIGTVVIDTQRQLFQVADEMIVSESNVTKNLISLYRSLGGGWEWSTGDVMMQGVIEAFPEMPEEITPEMMQEMQLEGAPQNGTPLNAPAQPMSYNIPASAFSYTQDASLATPALAERPISSSAASANANLVSQQSAVSGVVRSADNSGTPVRATLGPQRRIAGQLPRQGTGTGASGEATSQRR